MAPDPVLSAIVRLGLAGLFGFAAMHKARDRQAFSATVRDYRIVPERLSRVAPVILITAETAIAVGLLFPGAGAAAGIAAALLLASYTAAIGLNLLRGRRHIDCGCLGPGRGQPISEWLMGRNALLIAAALVAALPPGARPFGWIDAISLGGGLIAAVLLFGAASQLAGQADTSQRLRRSP